LAVTLIATFVMLWNMLTGEYMDLVGDVHPGILRGQYTPVLQLPMNPFTLSSSFLGLLLVFRTNKAYQRWDEARKNWGMNMWVNE
jgi:putative membrane protein